MKIYRSHSEEFQKQIEKGQFVSDFSRKFNTASEGSKNGGQLFFYAATIANAMDYSKGGEFPIFSYSFSGNLLDLRIKENRALLTAVIEEFVRSEEEERKSRLSFYEGKNVHPAVVAPLKEGMTAERVVNDDRLDGLSYWGQRATDYGMGAIMRSELERLGFDGIIFEESNSLDIALLNPAKMVA